MKYSKRFENATQALVSAFLNDTLAKGTCTACAVGNIVAHSLGGQVKSITHSYLVHFTCDKENNLWGDLFKTSFGRQGVKQPTLDSDKYRALGNITSTGYSQQELMRVEYAFETNTLISYIRYARLSKSQIMEDQYKGLMAVMDVLFDIEGVQEEDRKEYIGLFQKCK